MRKHFVIGLACSLISVVAFVVAGVHFAQGGNPFAVPSLLGLGCIFLSFTINQAIKDNKRNEVLRELNLDRPYLVLHRSVDKYGNNLMSLLDVVTDKICFAVISGVYPPEGFREVKNSHGNLGLVPKDNPFIDVYFGTEKKTPLPDIAYEDTV